MKACRLELQVQDESSHGRRRLAGVGPSAQEIRAPRRLRGSQRLRSQQQEAAVRREQSKYTQYELYGTTEMHFPLVVVSLIFSRYFTSFVPYLSLIAVH